MQEPGHRGPLGRDCWGGAGGLELCKSTGHPGEVPAHGPSRQGHGSPGARCSRTCPPRVLAPQGRKAASGPLVQGRAPGQVLKVNSRTEP